MLARACPCETNHNQMPITGQKGNRAAARALLVQLYTVRNQLKCTTHGEVMCTFLFCEEYHPNSQIQGTSYTIRDTRGPNACGTRTNRLCAGGHQTRKRIASLISSLALLYICISCAWSRCPTTTLLQGGCAEDHPAAVPPATGNRRRLEGRRLQQAEDLARSVAR